MLYILYNMDCVYLFSAAMYFWFQCYFCICCLLQCSVARYQLQFISYTTLLTMATESIPTIQVGPHPHYKHKHGHGHHKHVKRPCKYYNQSGCRYKHEQCWYEHKPHIESVTHLILKSLQDLSRKFQENIQKTDLEMQNIHNKLNVIQQGQTHISQRLEAVEIGIQATHREISLNKQKLNTSHSSINTKLNKIKNEIRQSNASVINSQARINFNVGNLSQELTGLKEGMNSIESMVKNQMNRTPINIRSIPNLRSKSTKPESEQQDIKQTEQLKEFDNKESVSVMSYQTHKEADGDTKIGVKHDDQKYDDEHQRDLRHRTHPQNVDKIPNQPLVTTPKIPDIQKIDHDTSKVNESTKRVSELIEDEKGIPSGLKAEDVSDTLNYLQQLQRSESNLLPKEELKSALNHLHELQQRLKLNEMEECYERNK
eukprot:1158708_1